MACVMLAVSAAASVFGLRMDTIASAVGGTNGGDSLRTVLGDPWLKKLGSWGAVELGRKDKY